MSERVANPELLMITFVWALPYRVPVPHLTTIPVPLDGDLGPTWDFVADLPSLDGEVVSTSLRTPRVSVRFWQRRSQTAYTTSVAPALEVMATIRGAGTPPDYDEPTMADYITVVDAVTQLPTSADIDANLSHAYDRCLVAVNQITRAYALSTFDPDAFRLRRVAVEPVCVYYLRDVSGADRGAGALVLNSNLPSELPILDASAMDRLADFQKLVAIRSPLVPAMEFSLEGKRAFGSGDYSVAVVMAATALEMTLNMLLRLLLAEEGRTTPEIDELFALTQGLKTRLETEYARRIGGNWTVETGQGQIASWWRLCFVPRSRAVHGGYQATQVEAEAASDACVALDQFLRERLAASRFKYPKTAYTKLGEAGLRRRGLLSARLEALLDEIDPTIPAFWDIVR